MIGLGSGKIVQVQLCALTIRSLHGVVTFKRQLYTFTNQAITFFTTSVYIVKACLIHLVATWWQFPSHVCKLGILTLLLLLENEHKCVICWRLQVCAHQDQSKFVSSKEIGCTQIYFKPSQSHRVSVLIHYITLIMPELRNGTFWHFTFKTVTALLSYLNVCLKGVPRHF